MIKSIIRFFRRFISVKMKDKILHSFPYRLYSRVSATNSICISCEITTRCNISCDMCTRASLVKNGKLKPIDMDEQITEKLLDGIKRMWEKGISVYVNPMGMGEPLLAAGWKNFFLRVKDISPKIPTILVTNGISMVSEVCEEIIQAKIDEVTVSLNAKDEETYKEHMGANRYEMVFENIKTLFKTRSKLKSKFPRINIQYLAYDGNTEAFSEEIKNWRRLMREEDKCYVHPIVNQAGLQESTNIGEPDEKRYPCTQPLWRIAIKRDGSVYPCDPCFYGEGEDIKSLYMGNILERGLDEIFSDKDSVAKKAISDMRRNNYKNLPSCEKCNNYKLIPNIYFHLPLLSTIKKRYWL